MGVRAKNEADRLIFRKSGYELPRRRKKSSTTINFDIDHQKGTERHLKVFVMTHKFTELPTEFQTKATLVLIQ